MSFDFDSFCKEVGDAFSEIGFTVDEMLDAYIILGGLNTKEMGESLRETIKDIEE